MDIEATKIALLTGLLRNTVNRYLTLILTHVAELCELESPFRGVIEVDDLYFGPRRFKSKRGREAAAKTLVFGIFQRDGKVYTEIVPDCAKATLQAIIRGKVDPESVIHSHHWRGYVGLADLGYNKHFRVQHGADEFVNSKNHINGIESFWAFAKARLMKFKGVNNSSFYLHLKESELGFNHRDQDLCAILLRTLREKTLNQSMPTIKWKS